MNKLLMILTLATTLLISSFSGCKKDDNSSTIASQVAALNQTAQTGNWKITYYLDNGVNKTSTYTGYVFQFNANGTITATKASSTIGGTWSGGNDDDTIKFIMNFGTTSPFLELNDDWHVTQQGAAIIRLEDVSGGGGGTDYLTFEKI